MSAPGKAVKERERASFSLLKYFGLDQCSDENGGGGGTGLSLALSERVGDGEKDLIHVKHRAKARNRS